MNLNEKIMKYILIALITWIAIRAESQNLTSTNPARLQVYLSTGSGEQIMLSCDDFNNQFSQLTMHGELDIRTLVTDDPGIRALLDTTSFQKITYSTVIPEGQFAFHDTYNYTFTTEAELVMGEKSSRFILKFDITSRKTDVANTFSVTCSGALSLEKDLGIIVNGQLQDQVSFQLSQNVRSLTY